MVLLLFYVVGIPLVQSSVRTKVEDITHNALASVVYVNDMRLDLHRENAILEKHILSKDRDSRASLGKELADTERHFAATARQYAPLATYPGEKLQSDEFQRDAAAYRETFPDILALSSTNNDAAAQRLLDATYARLTVASQAGDRLAGLNVAAARRASDEIRRILFLMNSVSVGLGAIVVLAAVFVGQKAGRVEAAAESSTRVALALEAQNRELDAFAGRVAHDLRGPLQVLQLNSASLSRRLPQEDATAKAFARTVTRLEAIIHDLLALSRIGAGSVVGDSDPAEVAVEIREELLPLLRSQGAALQVDVEPACISCSNGLVRQLLYNLVDNALKYRKPDVPAVIEVHGRQTDDVYELRVSDNGLGMSEEDARQVFKPFYRGASAVTGPPGTGLGLSIVKRVADAVGGNVSIASEVGRGTTFFVTLPCKCAPARQHDEVREGPPGHHA